MIQPSPMENCRDQEFFDQGDCKFNVCSYLLPHHYRYVCLHLHEHCLLLICRRTHSLQIAISEARIFPSDSTHRIISPDSLEQARGAICRGKF